MTDPVRREHLVHGPPGTGKTGFLSRQAPIAADKYGAPSVIVVSMTKGAAEEIGSRIDRLPEDNVNTLHAFAYRALGRPALAENAEGLKAWNMHAEAHSPNLKIARTGASPDADAPMEMAAASTDGERMLDELQTRRARMEPPDQWPSRLRHFADLWTAWKDDTERIDFTDMVERLLLHDPRPDAGDWSAEPYGDGPGVAGRFPGSPSVVMIDEAQDLSRLEMALVRKLAHGGDVEQVVIVGDSFQNLYEWRGSEPEVFAGGDYASERVLEQSWRVPKAVLDYARAWVTERIDLPFPEYRPRLADPEDPDAGPAPGEVRHLACRYRAPAPLIRAIETDIAKTVTEKVWDGQGGWEERTRPATVMVLASCRYMLDVVVRELRDAGVPFHNPYRPSQGQWNPMKGASKLAAFLRPDPDLYGSEHRVWTWRDLHNWLEPLGAKGVVKRGGKVFVEGKLLEDRFGESQADDPVDFSVLQQILEEDALDKAFDLDVEWWASQVRGKRSKQFAYPLGVIERLGRKALLERPQVVLGTIHSVKGAEADHVYVFPDLSHQGFWRGWQIPNTRGPVVRQFYVAMTRARDTLTVMDPSGAEYAQLPNPRRK